MTNSPEEISQVLLMRLGVGVTAWSAQGMFTKAEHTVLFCTVIRSDANTLKHLVLEIDADAFIVIGQGHRASGGMVKRQT